MTGVEANPDAGTSAPDGGRVVAATYARWRATTLGSITEGIETAVVSALAGELAVQEVLAKLGVDPNKRAATSV